MNLMLVRWFDCTFQKIYVGISYINLMNEWKKTDRWNDERTQKIVLPEDANV